ncbi:molecular chaperone [Diaphorobacter ruginosibacter]|uniref:Molecular chaperone n=1 Tax=Diaphorobacter ruginosibacter TaxID=1715720 RepID=A0A7G9RQ69_9BURK|nr:molecular chaperone [Diaphorobacter ruginosibacter]QNN57744.1 molecular chaperone [Diaphorobacter ruginosibacter]
MAKKCPYALRRSVFALWGLGAIFLSSPANAAGLEVAPTTLQIEPSQNANGITLNNSGALPLRAQVRVFEWTQKDNRDLLTPTTALTVSPPMLQIAPGGTQLLRVIRTSPPVAEGQEAAYRLIIDELPPAESPAPVNAEPTPPTKATTALTFLMRYSLPVFLGPEPHPTIGTQLAWTVEKTPKTWTFKLKNNAPTRAQIADIEAITADDKRIKLANGLLGYALAGQTMEWSVPAPVTQQRIVGYEALINRFTQALNVSSP